MAEKPGVAVVADSVTARRHFMDAVRQAARPALLVVAFPAFCDRLGSAVWWFVLARLGGCGDARAMRS